jgi:hypothetical protein
MSYGMKIYYSDNTVAFDSTSPGGVFLKYIELPASTTYIDNLAVEYFSADYIGRTLIIYPLILGNHYWFFIPGNAQSGQVPELRWSDDRYIAPGQQRKPTTLMVLVK